MRAWWAAVYGVAQSRTRLKGLSSSSSSSKLSCWPACYRKQYLWETSTSHLQVKFVISYISVEAIDCLHVFWSQFKVKHLEGKKNHIDLSPKELASPWGLEDFPAGCRQKEGTGKTCLSSVSRWISLGPSAEFSPLLPTPSPSLSTSQTLQCISRLSF